MINIFQYLITFLIGLFIAIVLFTVGLLTIPKKWALIILRIIKPSLLADLYLTQERYFDAITSTVIDGKHGDFNSNHKVAFAMEKLKGYVDQLKLIESNLFTMDMITSLIDTLAFVLVQTGFSTNDVVYEQVTNYFLHYTSKLYETSYRSNFSEDIIKKFEEFQTNVKGTEKFDEDGIVASWQTYRSQQQSIFSSFLDKEKKELERSHELIKDAMKTQIRIILTESRFDKK